MNIRGAYRFPLTTAPSVAAAAATAPRVAAAAAAAPAVDRDFSLSSESTAAPPAIPAVPATAPAGTAASPQPQWLSDSSRLIPGEALAGYLSLQALTRVAQRPEQVVIVLALAFLVVTIVVRWFGSQDPNALNPKGTTQPVVIAVTAFSYVALVYATGGQIFWHAPVVNQQLYGQIAAGALGVLGPTLVRTVVT